MNIEAEAESVKLVPTMEGARFHEGQVVKYVAKGGYILVSHMQAGGNRIRTAKVEDGTWLVLGYEILDEADSLLYEGFGRTLALRNITPSAKDDGVTEIRYHVREADLAFVEV